jgi:predicted permease
METIGQDLRYALRTLLKSKGFLLASVLTLALGIGANTAMFSIVYAWLLRPLPLKNPQELFAVWRTQMKAPHQPAYFDNYRDYLVWSTQNRTFQSLAATFEQTYAISGAGRPAELHGAVASWNLFDTIGATPALGRLFEAEDAGGGPACVISYSLWKEQFHGAKDIVGNSIQLNRKAYRVLGVLPEHFSFRVLDRPFETAIWTVLTADDAVYRPTSFSPVAVIGRIRKGAGASQAEADLSILQTQLNKRFSDDPENSGILVVNLQEDNTRHVRSSLLLLFGGVSILLLIACANTGSLILGRNARRAKEFAVRLALGCSNGRLLQQLSLETATIFAMGGALGLFLAFGIVRMFAAWNPFGVLPPEGFSFSGAVLALTAGIALAMSLLFGSVPAFRAIRVREQESLQASSRTASASRQQLRSRSVLVAVEVSLATVLLVGAGLLLATFMKIDSEPLGFQTRDVLVTSVALPNSVYQKNEDQSRFVQRVLEKLSAMTGVRAAGAAFSWPFNENGSAPVDTRSTEARPSAQLAQAAILEASPGYFGALGIPLLLGRDFSADDTAGSAPVAVINEEMARQLFGAKNPIGQQIRQFDDDQDRAQQPWLSVVGVVATTLSLRYHQIAWEGLPAVYTSLYQNPIQLSSIATTTRTVYLYVQGRPVTEQLIASVVNAIDPELPLGVVQSTGEIVSGLRAQPRARAALLVAFGALTLLLTAIGVGGVISQTVEQRRRDIGIRLALGAMTSNVRNLVLGQALRLAVWGIAIGLSAAASLTRLLRSFLLGVSPLDPLTFAGVAIFLCAIAAAAAYVPAMRAARLDPIVTLRSE